MTGQIRSFDSHFVSVVEEPGRAFEIVRELESSGTSLLGFSMMPDGSGKVQLDLIPERAEVDTGKLKGLGLSPGMRRTGFLVRGPLGEAADKLAQAGIPITSIQAMAYGDDCEAFLWVAESDLQRAESILGNSAGAPDTAAAPDTVDEASEESFPASDPPSFAGAWSGDR